MEYRDRIMNRNIVIIGGGITGCALARDLSRYQDLTIHLIEKENDVGWGATKANTGIIHPGHEDDPTRYPFRSHLCVRGNDLWRTLSNDLDIPTTWPGELMIARDELEKKELKRFFSIGKENGVKDLRIIDGSEIFDLEPNCTNNTIAALWAPTAGLIEPWEATIALIENAVDNGVKVHLNTKVSDLIIENEQVRTVRTNNGSIPADIVINAAGLFADNISKMASIEEGSIRPRKGQYFLFDEDATPKVNRIIHQVPSQTTKGVYAVTTVEGNLMLGPTAEDLNDDEKDERGTDQKGLDHVWDHATTLLKELPPKKRVSKIFAGLRPEPPNGKYIIKSYDKPWGFINVMGIRSPGLTAAPAISEYVTSNLLKKDLDINLIEKKTWNPYRKRIQRFSQLSTVKQNEYIKENKAYGTVVCMCKEITEAEIVDAIQRIQKLGGPVTVDSVKFRTLAMFGFCQGSFCRSKIACIISEQLNIPLYKVLQNTMDTDYGIGKIKTLLKENGGLEDGQRV